MAAKTNVVNLDALIRRADLAAPGEQADDTTSLTVVGLEARGWLYPAVRKPDFQRETASWSPEQVADLVTTFAHRDLIPAVILWRAGQHVFVIDGAHRLSALVAWVHDDYGDGEASRRFFQNVIPEEQKRAAQRARQLIKDAVGSYQDHKLAIEYPYNSDPEIAQRAQRIGWQEIPAQWIRNADHDKAEKAFFRINQGGTKIDKVEERILAARRSATALASRAILRGGTGHNYWNQFPDDVREQIEALGRDVHQLLFEPQLSLPVKTLDLPLAGQGYGAHVLPFVFDLVNVANGIATDSSRKGASKDRFQTDEDGTSTITYLRAVREQVRRLCSSHASSIGLHPALYFYSRNGVFQPAALLGFLSLIRSWDTNDFIKFCSIRSKFEQFLMAHSGITDAIRDLGSGARSRPRVVLLHQTIISELTAGRSVEEVERTVAGMPEFNFLDIPLPEVSLSRTEKSFSRGVKGAAFLREAIPSAPKCPTCGGFMHRNAMQAGHRTAKREGGSGALANAMMQHPFCNSTVEN